MRDLVQPPPSTHCEFCDGELRFKCIEPADPAMDIEVQIFICEKCGREQSRNLIHGPYAAYTVRSVPLGKVAQASVPRCKLSD